MASSGSSPYRSRPGRRAGLRLADQPELVERPVREPGLADDVVARDGAPDVRVARVVPVVAKDEVFAWLDPLRWRGVVPGLVDVGLVDELAVDEDAALPNLDRV